MHRDVNCCSCWKLNFALSHKGDINDVNAIVILVALGLNPEMVLHDVVRKTSECGNALKKAEAEIEVVGVKLKCFLNLTRLRRYNTA